MRRAFWGVVGGAALILSPLQVAANDADASVALGGVVLGREPRISMESERLTVSLSKVTVEYEFLNESDKDITTEVAFPIPPYEFTEAAGGTRAFDDFRLWVDGKELPYEVEAKAFLQRYGDQGKKVGDTRDVTAILEKYKIDVPTLGHYLVNGKYASSKGGDDIVPDFERLSPAIRKRVSDLGLVDAEGDRSVPQWEVRKTYYWRQTFPAHKVLRVRHEYSPGFGFQGIHVSAFNDLSRSRSAAKNNADAATDHWEYYNDDSRLLRDSCVDPSIQKATTSASGHDGYVEGQWVDYILTTANSWKTPIKKFELIVERGPKKDMGWYSDDWDYASFCWDGPVKRVDAHRYEASVTNFVPKRELKVLFLAMPVAEAASADGTPQHAPSSWLFRQRLWVGLVLGAFVLTGLWWVWLRRTAG